MRAKVLGVAATVLAALAIAPAAFADGSGGPGGFQAGVQGASTTQGALGVALSNQNAVNANVPVSIAGGNVTSGSSTAAQAATSTANADVKNKSKTDQDQTLNQNIGGSGCVAGCGGAGGFQAGVQKADTKQIAVGVAKSDQNAVNANVPVTIAGGNVTSGPSDATQNASSEANADVKNKSKTNQDQTQNQNIGGSGSCKAGCGGSGGFQVGIQHADTKQIAAGIAKSDQNAVNANVPVTIAGGNVNSGPSTATQNATSTATTDVKNKSKTDQDQTLNQNIGGSGCYAGCGGPGGFQLGVQKADTKQIALGFAKSKQNAVNGNTPVSIAGGDITSGPSTASQTATSTADADVKNKAKTDQDQELNQNIGSGKEPVRSCGCEGKKDREPSCVAGCGGAGGFQVGVQKAETNQFALGVAKSDQNAVNGNSPVSIAGGNIYAGPSNATQTATSTADTDVKNKAKTEQDQTLNQNIGSSGCYAGCGGPGGFQLGVQKAETNQIALGFAKSDQNAVNGNAPVDIAGGDITSGPSSATQTATSTADADVKNKAKTDQDQTLNQNIGSDKKSWDPCSCKDKKHGKDDRYGKDDKRDGMDGSYGKHDKRDDKDGRKDDRRDGSCSAGCGGAGGFQLGVQAAETNQIAAGFAKSDQNAVNSNAPSSTAGGDITGGRTGSNATQTATSSANADVKNKAKTDQDQTLNQNLGSSGCHLGCGGAGGFQAGIQLAETNQIALGFAKSDQNAVNGNSPHSIAGGNIYDGPSDATQTATSYGSTDVKNKAKTDQNQWENPLMA